MPSFPRHVSFTTDPVYSRMPRDDEVYVMRNFAKHASHCDTCRDPYAIHRASKTLCAKGHQRAVDVAQYVYNKNGQAYSLVDREGHQRVQIEIPIGCESVRLLLKAMERGLRIYKITPKAKSYDKTYYVPARPVIEQRPRTQELRLETAEAPAGFTSAPPTRRTATTYVGKGSLYERDVKEREQYYKTVPTVYVIQPKTPPAQGVPSKDHYWR